MTKLGQGIIDQNLIDDFINESRDDIEEAINYIMTLERDSRDTESLHALFRKSHTIKGNAGILGQKKT